MQMQQEEQWLTSTTSCKISSYELDGGVVNIGCLMLSAINSWYDFDTSNNLSYAAMSLSATTSIMIVISSVGTNLAWILEKEWKMKR